MTSPFLPGPALRIASASGGPLAGLTFAAKDLFDVAGHPTGGGNPDWARQNPIPTRHAWAVQRQLDAGLTLIGKTITDEVSLGILGENPFDGTPLNPKAPDRVSGGSSSGSAPAVAQGLCDTALGTDTGGSVRVPASFCGLYGIRPTHGRLDLRGMMPPAPSSDTTGWFARDASTFARVSEVLLGEPIRTSLPITLVVAVDAFGLADAETAAALQPMVRRLSALVRDVREDLLAPPGAAGESPGRARGRAAGGPVHPRRARQQRRAGGGGDGDGDGGRPMSDVTADRPPSLPDVVVEVRELSERYEQALIDKNVEVLDATFWDSPHTIRYAMHENGYGFGEIHAHRLARPLGPGIKERRIRLEILTLGRDFATVNLEFKMRGRELVGRQSQTWVRFPGLGWKMVAAHVSTMNEAPQW